MKEVVEAIDLSGSDWESYLNPETGEIVMVTDEDRSLLASDDVGSDLPEWQQESLEKAREVEASGQYLTLPDRFEIDEWSMMRNFCHTLGDSAASEELLDSVHGSGAFRRFRQTADRLGLLDAWYTYRGTELERIAREWLEEHGIAYK